MCQVAAHRLADLGAIDLDVDLLRLGGERLRIAGDAIVEAHAERDHEVGLLNGVVHPRLAVHAHHAERERMRRREGAEPEQRRRDGDVGLLGERAHRRRRARLDDALPDEQQRPLGGVDHRRRALELLRQRLARWSRAAVGDTPTSSSHEACCASLVMSTSTGPGRPLRAMANACRSVGAISSTSRDEEVVLGDRQRHAGDVGLLERVRCRGASTAPAR